MEEQHRKKNRIFGFEADSCERSQIVLIFDFYLSHQVRAAAVEAFKADEGREVDGEGGEGGEGPISPFSVRLLIVAKNHWVNLFNCWAAVWLSSWSLRFADRNCSNSLASTCFCSCSCSSAFSSDKIFSCSSGHDPIHPRELHKPKFDQNPRYNEKRMKIDYINTDDQPGTRGEGESNFFSKPINPQMVMRSMAFISALIHGLCGNCHQAIPVKFFWSHHRDPQFLRPPSEDNIWGLHKIPSWNAKIMARTCRNMSRQTWRPWNSSYSKDQNISEVKIEVTHIILVLHILVDNILVSHSFLLWGAINQFLLYVISKSSHEVLLAISFVQSVFWLSETFPQLLSNLVIHKARSYIFLEYILCIILPFRCP